MQKPPPNPLFETLLASLPESESELLERARVLREQGDLSAAAELLHLAHQRCATPAISREFHAIKASVVAEHGDPDTQELEEIEVATLESRSLELNAFERSEVLDESDIFSGSSFDNLSSLQAADGSPTLNEETHLDTDEMPKKDAPKERSDTSVNELLVDLGLPVAGLGDGDDNATRSLRGRLDDVLGVQRDDLLDDYSALVSQDLEEELDFGVEPLDASAFLEDDEFDEDESIPEEVMVLEDDDFVLEADTAPELSKLSAPVHLHSDDTEILRESERLSPTAPVDDAWGDYADSQTDADIEWDDIPDTEFQMQSPLELPEPHAHFAGEPAAASPDWRIGNGDQFYGSNPDVFDDPSRNAIELDSIEVADREPIANGFSSSAARNRRTDRLFAIDAKRPAPAPKSAPNSAQLSAPALQRASVQKLRNETTPNPSAPSGGPVSKILATLAAPELRGAVFSFARKYALALVAAGVMLFLIVAVALVGSESSSAADAIRARMAQWRTQSLPDTYQGYLQGEQILEDALATNGPMGATIDTMLGGIGLMGSAEEARGEALAELAHLRAMIEYRYEYLDTRDSEKTIQRARALAPGNPQIEIARAYQLLSKSHYSQAIALLGDIRKHAPNSEAATIALIHAQLDAGNIESASMATLPIRSKLNPSVHEHYLLGLVDFGLGKVVQADARFRHIFTILSTSHIWSRIARSQTVRQTDDPKALGVAAGLLENVLQKYAEHASPLQLAHAHLAMAEVEVLRKDLARAEEHLQQAIKMIPQRSAVYAPMVHLYINDGRLDKALQLIKDAEGAGVSSTQLLLQRAEIYRLISRPKQAIKTIELAELTSAEAYWQKGLANRDLNFVARAREDFATALKMDEKFAPARASAFLLEEVAQPRARRALEKPFEKLLKDNPTTPAILHDGALGLMHIARVSDAMDERPALLARAKTMLEDALEHGGNPALLNYSLCEQSMLAHDAQAALKFCDAAQKINPQYLPGVLTAAKLHLKRDAAGDAFFDELSRAFPNDPSVSQHHALHWLNRFQISKAETAINRWAGGPAATTSLHLFAEGRLSFTRGKYAAALGYFERAHKQSPGSARAAIHFARTLSNLGENDRAETILKPALDDIEWGPIAWVVFGQIRREQNRLQDASQNLNIASKKLSDAIVSKYWITQLHLQKALTNAARHDGAHPTVERELQLGAEAGDPGDPALNMAWSRYYLALRSPDAAGALEALRRVTRVQPSHCGALRALHQLYTDFSDLEDPDTRAEVDTQLSQFHCEG